MLKTIQRFSTHAVMGISLLLTASVQPAGAVETTDPIRIVTIDSSDADYVAHVYGAILKEVGYNVKFMRVDYSAQMSGLETGDLDVTTGIWDTSSWQQLIDTVKTGAVANYGSVGVEVEEGWWYPKYLEKHCPGLPNWEALKSESCVKALMSAETAPKGRYIDAPADWETDSQTRMDALELPYEVISSGSPVTMVATVKSAIDRQEPIFSWGYRPHWFYDGAEGSFVKLPANDGECYDDPAWGVNKKATYDCGYSVGYLWKMGSKAFAERAPLASRILHLFTLQTLDVAKATGRVENGGEKIEAVAAEWVKNNEALWKSWLN